jgi:predicted Rossmann fold flavoprotein
VPDLFDLADRPDLSRRADTIIRDVAAASSCVDLVVVGGGAAGLAAAIFAAEAASRVRRIAVLDGARALGAKILVSGGGRCNVTHYQVLPEDFNGSRNVVRNILAAFDAAATVRWFQSLGVELKREPTGKLFPVADSARVVVDALLRRCRELGVEIQTGCRVANVVAPAADEPAFIITHAGGTLRAARVVFSTGGRSLPRSGSDGTGWEILLRLGHTVTPTYAALVPLVLAPQMVHAELSGISQAVELSVFVAGKRVDHRAGSLLWTHFGASGPVVMDASRHWTSAHEQGLGPAVKCNLLPGETFESVERWFIRSVAERPRATVLTLFTGRLPERVAAAVIRNAGIDPATGAAQVSRDARRTLVHALTGLVLPVTQHRGWNYAEVTAGGVPLAEINFRTMQSRKVPGLYLAGEVLDCDGRIGGFNFQWAWSTGFLAGRAAAASLGGSPRDAST